MRHTNRSFLAHSSLILAVAAALLAGCGSDDGPAAEASGGAAGSSGSGNGGGDPGSGGKSSGSGGTSATTGGGTSTGNAGGDGGSMVEDPDSGTGGSPSSGGAPGTGGASPATGGVKATGGVAATGGASPSTGGAPPAPKCGTDYNDDPTCNTCMTTKCCDQLKACVPNSPCEKFLQCAVDKCPSFNSGCLQLNCTAFSAGAQPAADLIECRRDCTAECPLD